MSSQLPPITIQVVEKEKTIQPKNINYKKTFDRENNYTGKYKNRILPGAGIRYIYISINYSILLFLDSKPKKRDEGINSETC